MEQLIIVTTSDTIENHEIKEYLGIVSARNWVLNAQIQYDIKKKEKNIENYRKFIEETEQALVTEAKEKGGNAVIGVTIDVVREAFGPFITMYGTAVRIE